jgi:hypothetical protein
VRAVYVELRRGNPGDVSLDVRHDLLCETGNSEADEGGDEQTRSHFVRSVIPELLGVNVVMKRAWRMAAQMDQKKLLFEDFSLLAGSALRKAEN